MYKTYVRGEDALGNEYVDVNSDSEQQMVEPMGVDLSEHQHLTPNMFSKPQKIDVDIDITASPAELAAMKSASVWKLMPHLGKDFKQNLATKDRHLASDDQLAGNLNRCIPLNLEIVQQKNSFPFFMGIRIPGMMDRNLHRHGKCVYRVAPDTHTMMVGRSAFEPTNIINEWAYNNYKMCTLEDLDNDVTFVKGTKSSPPYAQVNVNSVAYAMLKQNLEAGSWNNVQWTPAEHDLIDLDHIFEPKRSQKVQVPERMGREIVKDLRSVIEETAKGFINVEDFNVEIVRADGYKAFDKKEGIHGELIGSDIVDAPVTANSVMQTRQTFHLKCELTYVLF
ncbi:MAG: hypothetical protein K2Q45_05330 [Nitrosomonas sp.]|nr:hypothetical protein [Nitrosomonas sp.]